MGCTTIAPAPPPPDPPTFVDFPPAPPPPITKARTDVTAAGTVHVVVPVRVKVRTQSPPGATVIVTPVALSTSAVHEPFVTVAACAGDTNMVNGIATTDTEKIARTPQSRATPLLIRLDLIIPGLVEQLRT